MCLTIGLGRGGCHGVGDECAVESGKSGGLGVLRYRGSGEDGPVAELPATGYAPLEIGLGLGQWGVAAAGEPRDSCPRPHFLFILRSAAGAH
jgi:hypothetical protein